MTTPTNDLRRGALLLIALAVMSAYPVSVAMLGPRSTIEGGNVVMLSLAFGIVVAYAPSVWHDLRSATLDGAAILSVGIFSSWLAIIYRTGSSIIWRLNDKPVEWLDSVLWGFHIAVSCFAALCHLIAPEAVSGRVPTRQWVRIGVLVAGGVFIGAGMVVLNLD